jgi:hypothetical protein
MSRLMERFRDIRYGVPDRNRSGAMLRLPQALAALAILGGAGCHSAGPSARSLTPSTSLAAAGVPPNADLSGVRGVEVRIPAIPVAGRIDLLRPDGKVVYTGVAKVGRAFTGHIVMPTKDVGLTAILRVSGFADRSLRLAIVAGSANGTFQ